MEHQKIFATNLFLLDEFVPQSTSSEKEVVNTMKKYISDLWTKRDYDKNWQTKSADLHTKKEFQHFSTLVLKTAHDICNTLGYDVKDLITHVDNKSIDVLEMYVNELGIEFKRDYLQKISNKLRPFVLFLNKLFLFL